MKNKILKQTIKTVMGTIKIELDLPGFDNNLDINISLKKDNDGVMKVCPSWTTTPIPTTTNPYPYVDPDIIHILLTLLQMLLDLIVIVTNM